MLAFSHAFGPIFLTLLRLYRKPGRGAMLKYREETTFLKLRDETHCAVSMNCRGVKSPSELSGRRPFDSPSNALDEPWPLCAPSRMVANDGEKLSAFESDERIFKMLTHTVWLKADSRPIVRRGT